MQEKRMEENTAPNDQPDTSKGHVWIFPSGKKKNKKQLTFPTSVVEMIFGMSVECVFPSRHTSTQLFTWKHWFSLFLFSHTEDLTSTCFIELSCWAQTHTHTHTSDQANQYLVIRPHRALDTHTRSAQQCEMKQMRGHWRSRWPSECRGQGSVLLACPTSLTSTHFSETLRILLLVQFPSCPDV